MIHHMMIYIKCSRIVNRYLPMVVFSLFVQCIPMKSQWIMMRSDADSLVQMGATMIYN
ncbi:MAG: hypothetical protein RLZZ578_1893, partial [Bacteroidota bacterium]